MTDLAAEFTALQARKLPDHLGLEWKRLGKGAVDGRFAIREHHVAPNGYLHAASIIALADTACGYGCMASLPDGASGFTTIELKSNFLGTLLEGAVACEARLVHGGRTTQVWDAAVRDEAGGRTLALFRCTQMILYPR